MEQHKTNSGVGVIEGGSASPLSAFVPQGAFFQAIWRGRWIVLISTVVILAAGFVYVMKATPIYTSTSRLYVEQSGPRIIGEMEGVMTQSKNYLYTQAQLMVSTPILKDALEEPGVRTMRTFAEVDNPITYLKRHVVVEVGKKDDIITVAFDSAYPEEAAHLVNTLVDAYVSYHVTQKKNTSAEVFRILNNEHVRRNQELMEKLKVLVEFKKENEALAFENKNSNIILDRLAGLSEAVTQAQLNTIEAKSAMDTVQTMISDPVKLKHLVQAERARGVYVSTDNESQRLQRELDRLEVEMMELRAELTTEHPAVRRVAEQIEKTRMQIASLDTDFAEAQLAVAQQAYEAAKAREKEITAYFNEQRAKALELNEQLAQYTLLESDWQQTRKLADLLEERIKELKVTEDAGALNISILEVARPEERPSKPQKAKILAMTLLLGLVLGGGASLVYDTLDHRLRSAEEIQGVLGMPLLGSVPSMPRRRSVQERGRVVQQESSSVHAEAYKTVRTAIFFGVPEGAAKTLLITSPDAGDGKTTLASNLAIAMAQAGQKTLIVDADLRKPMQNTVFQVSREKGLSAVVSGRLPLSEAILPTDVAGLEIIPAGPDVPNPSELLNSRAFVQRFKELCEQYDRIVVDSPPVIRVTDAQILSAMCDATVLVVRAEKSKRNMSRHACESLLSVGGKLLGVVVNDVSRRRNGYGYYSGYGYYRPYGESKKAVS